MGFTGTPRDVGVLGPPGGTQGALTAKGKAGELEGVQERGAECLLPPPSPASASRSSSLFLPLREMLEDAPCLGHLPGPTLRPTGVRARLRSVTGPSGVAVGSASLQNSGNTGISRLRYGRGLLGLTPKV